HPLTNVIPEVRITGPSQDQDIAAGTFRIKVGVVATDDRKLDVRQSIKVFANGVPLAIEDVSPEAEEVSGGISAVTQAFADTHGSVLDKFGLEAADNYGTPNSAYALMRNYVVAIPANVVRANEPLKLTAYVYDSDNAV